MALKEFTGWEYLLIDLANAYGQDKELFEVRLKWANDNLHQLEALADQADSKPLYLKAVSSIRKAQAGIPSGHLVGFDATCSGIQVMSAITGCIDGATSVGLVDPNVRADAYTLCTKVMNGFLAQEGLSVSVGRKQAKDALMTTFYGSTAVPKKLFGEDTPELSAFYRAAATIAPGAWDLLQDLLASWQDGALEHTWKLPDGFDARIKVMSKIEDVRIEVDELDHATFSYEFYVNQGKRKGEEGTKSNAANVVHSIDAYVLRSVHRRCNYERDMVEAALELLEDERERRIAGTGHTMPTWEGTAMHYYVGLWEATHMADTVILPYLNLKSVQELPDALLIKLMHIIDMMLAHKPFAVITIHDEFKCHPNHMNHLRKHYVEVFAQLAESTVLDFILSSIYGQQGSFKKMSDNLGDLIRQSSYALC